MEFVSNYPFYTKTSAAADMSFVDYNNAVSLPDKKVLFTSYASIGVWDKKNRYNFFLITH